MAEKLNHGPSIDDEVLEEMKEQRDRLLALRAENKAQLDDLTARIDAQETANELTRRIANFTPAERDALFQELRASGINSGETFGTI